MSRATIGHLYAAFEKLDADSMAACYAPDARFDFWRWSRQALGAPGLLLGSTPMLRAKVHAQAAKNLARYMASRGAA